MASGPLRRMADGARGASGSSGGGARTPRREPGRRYGPMGSASTVHEGGWPGPEGRGSSLPHWMPQAAHNPVLHTAAADGVGAAPSLPLLVQPSTLAALRRAAAAAQGGPEGAEDDAVAGSAVAFHVRRAAPWTALHFRRQPVSTRRLLVREPWRMPIGAMHIAATAVQRWWRFQCLPAMPLPQPGAVRFVDVLPPERWAELPLYHVAALQIQRQARRSIPGLAALRVQRWLRARRRAAQDRAAFAYFKGVCLRFQRDCTPVELLRVLNPTEAGLVDAASGLTVSLRLGGASFPPAVYYKVATLAPVCDVGAFAPRSYATERLSLRERDADQVLGPAALASAKASLLAPPSAPAGPEAGPTPSGGRGRPAGGTGAGGAAVAGAGERPGWYTRWENNGWRPVAVKTLQEAEADPLTKLTAARRQPWHWSRLQRNEDRQAKRKERRRRWLMRLYREGLATDQYGVAAAQPGTRRGGQDASAELASERSVSLPRPSKEHQRPGSALSDASWATEDLRALPEAELRAAAERSVRRRLGLQDGAPLSVDAFLSRLLEEEEEEEEEEREGAGYDEEAKFVDDRVGRGGQHGGPFAARGGSQDRAGEPAEAEQSDGTALQSMGCPVDFDSPDWDAQASALLQWAEALDPDAYEESWAAGQLGQTGADE